jgi:hypothetical protein
MVLNVTVGRSPDEVFVVSPAFVVDAAAPDVVAAALVVVLPLLLPQPASVPAAMTPAAREAAARLIIVFISLIPPFDNSLFS